MKKSLKALHTPSVKVALSVASLALAGATLAGCSSSLSGPGDSQSAAGASGTLIGPDGNPIVSNGGAGGSSMVAIINPPPPPPDGVLDVNRVPIHRLNKAEYDNTVRDLLGVPSTPAPGFIADETAFGFDNIAEAFGMTDARFEEYYNAAEGLADAVFAAPALKAKIMTCTPTVADTACVGQIVSAFGSRAWRRPLTAAEVTRLSKVVTDALTLGEDADGSVKQLVKTMLSSLPFLYRIEMDATPTATDPAEHHPLDAYELASRLSYLTWSSMPDSALFDAAQTGGLANPAGLSTQLDRMLADPKANNFVINFAGQWLGMRKLLTHAIEPTAYPNWTPAMGAAMSEEGLQYFAQFLSPAGDMRNFLTTPLPGGTNPADVRVGFMGLKGFLTLTSFPYRTAPTLRGKWVLENLLCQPIPAPPAGVPKLDDPAAPTAMVQSENVRIRLEAHRMMDQTCNGCHSTLDPIGMGLENYDAIGEYRTNYANGDAVDPSGQLPALWNNQPFSSLSQLATILSADSKLTDCASKQLMTYALGRGVVASDDPYLKQIRDAWTAGGAMGMTSLLKQIVMNDTFRFRRGEIGVAQ